MAQNRSMASYANIIKELKVVSAIWFGGKNIGKFSLQTLVNHYKKNRKNNFLKLLTYINSALITGPIFENYLSY